MRVNVFKIADDTLVIALPTKSLVIDKKGYMTCEDYGKEGESRTTKTDLKNANAYDFVKMITNDLANYGNTGND